MSDRQQDPYRRNPAREIETLAVEVVQAWVGDAGTVNNTGSGHGPDFEIHYRDGRLAIGEVGWHELPRMAEMWSNTYKHERHQTVDLRPSSGSWAVQLVLGASIKRLYKDLPGFVSTLLAENVDRLDIVEAWPRSELADMARLLGIEHIEQVTPSGSDHAIFFMPGAGGAVPTDANVIAEWLEDVLADPLYADTTAKLLRLEANERHVFLMAGSATPFGAEQRLMRTTESYPSRPLTVPDGISHVWATSRFGGSPIVLWTRSGWSTVEQV